MDLTSAGVTDVVMECLYDDPSIDSEEKLPVDAIKVDAIVRRFAFDPIKVAANKVRIRGLLAELPTQFFKDSGGGWSFLNGCVDKHGNQWGEQKAVAELFALGQAAGFVTCLMPREIWGLLPGGVPYYMVDLSAGEVVGGALEKTS